MHELNVDPTLALHFLLLKILSAFFPCVVIAQINSLVGASELEEVRSPQGAIALSQSNSRIWNSENEFALDDCCSQFAVGLNHWRLRTESPVAMASPIHCMSVRAWLMMVRET